jgi:flagellar basal body-associated protein FliL
MNKKTKKIVLIIIGVAMVLFLGLLGLNYFIENKLKKQISEAPEHFKIQYEAIAVNALSGNVEVSKPTISVYEEKTKKLTATVVLEKFSVAGFSYFNYLLKDKISIDDIIFNQAKITYYKNEPSEEDSSKSIFEKLKQIVEIESIELKEAFVTMYDGSNDSLILKSDDLNFKFDAIKINPAQKKNPVSYRDFKLTSKATFYSLGEYENLLLESLDVNSTQSKFSGVKLKTKYSKHALTQMIKVERDHYNLAIDSITVKNQNFGFKQDSIFYFKSKRVDFHQPNFKIYRNKLVTDDMSVKPLYSKMLRDLGFDLTLDNVFLNNTSITYTEKTKEETSGGKILFSKLNAEIKNLSNTYKAKDSLTAIKVKAIFMDNTPIDVDWNFNVNNLQDSFVFKAKMGGLNAESMNQFMEPNLNIQLEGAIKQTYFTINGTDDTSHIDLQIKYDAFDVIILKEKTKKKNKLLSSIVNIFVSKDSEDVSNDFRKGSKSDIERVKNKSVFNYLWINIKEGLLHAMTGDGKKK